MPVNLFNLPCTTPFSSSGCAVLWEKWFS
uniref:Uncharacterized protein n=1 Tax=Anguilla anguilla TaxID=7936 RepID=A0A0E9T4H7_ANGAN